MNVKKRYKIDDVIVNTNITIENLKLQIKYYDFKKHYSIFEQVRKQWYEGLIVLISNQINYINKSLKTLESYITILNKFVFILNKSLDVSTTI